MSHVLDRGSEEVYDSCQVDELAEDHFTEELTQVDGVDESLAELLIEDYTNLRTVSWAATSDVEHLENAYDLDAHDFFNALGDTDVHRNEQVQRPENCTSPNTGTTWRKKISKKTKKTTRYRPVSTISEP